MARIEFGTYTDQEKWREGWVEIKDYLTLRDRTKLDTAGFRITGSFGRGIAARLDEIEAERGVSRNEAQRILAEEAEAEGEGQTFEFDPAAKQLAILDLAVEQYSIDGTRTLRNRHLADVLPDFLGKPVLDAVEAHYEATELTEEARKSLEPEGGRAAETEAASGGAGDIRDS